MPFVLLLSLFIGISKEEDNSLEWSWSSSGEKLGGGLPSGPDKGSLGLDANAAICTDQNKTFTVEIKVHTQDLVVRAIHSIATGTIDFRESEAEAVETYIGSIIDELNVMLLVYKIQLHLNLDGYNTDDFMSTNSSFDASCEKTSPVIERTSAAFSFLKQSFTDNIGIHLFVWACPYISSSSELETVYSNLRCGRVMGVLWRGSAETRALIKGVILNSLTNDPQAFTSAEKLPGPGLGAKLCLYVNQCVGMDKSEIGQLVPGTTLVKYTKTR